MGTRGMVLLVSAAMTIVGLGGSVAQGLPPPIYGPPAYRVQTPTRVEPLLPDDGALLPQEIVGLVQASGYAPFRTPVRRGSFYVVAVVHPNGERGRVVIDASSGRFIRFVATSRFGFPGAFAFYEPRPLRPPAPLTRGSVVSAYPPASKPLNGSPAKPGAPIALSPPTTTDAAIAANRAADARSAENRPSTEPVEVKPRFGVPEGPKLRPTRPMPPMQTLE